MAKEGWAARLKRELKEAQDEIAELKDKAILDTSDNIYTSEENKTIVVYKYGFWILAALNTVLLISLFF